MIVLSVVAALVALVLLVPALSDLCSLVVVASGRARQRTAALSQSTPRLLFLVPAHDEELLVRSCVQSLQQMRYPSDHYDAVVIADNCTDRTAEIVREIGGRCLERFDPALRGKPRAIAWALEQLPMNSYDAMVLIDADAVVDSGFAAGLAEIDQLRTKAAQPFNDVRNPNETSVTRMAAVLAGGMYRGAFVLKRRAGLNVPLGCGMCVGADILAKHGWTTFSLSEDWEFYASMAAEGVTIEFAPESHLYAQEAKSLNQSGSQRQRWLAGTFLTLFRRGPDILRSRQAGFRQKLDAFSELSATGPAVHLGIVSLVGLALVLLDAPAAIPIATALALSLMRPVGYAVVGLTHDPEPLGALRAFAYLPIYTLWRLLAFVGTIRMLGDKPWVRTARHEQQ